MASRLALGSRGVFRIHSSLRNNLCRTDRIYVMMNTLQDKNIRKPIKTGVTCVHDEFDSTTLIVVRARVKKTGVVLRALGANLARKTS